MEEEKVVLVDIQDQQIGTMGKMEAHEKAELHRTFSVFVLNSKRAAAQQRAREKYHSPGLWTNTCCSHQRVVNQQRGWGTPHDGGNGHDCPLGGIIYFYL